MIEIEKIYSGTCIILALLVIGEALALIIGMNLSGSEGKEWLSLKNSFLLIIDIAMGLLALILIFMNSKKKLLIFIIIVVIIICVSHFYREIEYFLIISNKFCINLPLFIFNSLKLILSLICIIFGIYVQYGIN